MQFNVNDKIIIFFCDLRLNFITEDNFSIFILIQWGAQKLNIKTKISVSAASEECCTRSQFVLWNNINVMTNVMHMQSKE